MNITGTWLKYVAGTMDNDDEEKIVNHLQKLDTSNNETSLEIDQITYLSTTLPNRVSKIATHINDQQRLSEKYHQ